MRRGKTKANCGGYLSPFLNIISIKDKEQQKIFKQVFSPISLLIDPNDASFNISLNLERDQVLGLNSLLI